MRRDPFSTLVGLLTFLGGVALLLFTFKLALDLFNVPPKEVLGLTKGQELNLNEAATSVIGVILKFLLLLIMGGLGSWIANRGVNLTAAALGNPMPTTNKRKKEEA